MKVLYVGQLWEGGTCLERMRTLSRMGCSMVPFDTTPFQQIGTRLERSIASRALIGRSVKALNSALSRRTNEPYDIVWIDKGVWIYDETLMALKRAAQKRFALHYTPDAQFLSHRSRHFLKCVPQYDLFVTTKPFELEAYQRAGANNTLLILQGYGPQFRPDFGSQAVDEALRSDVCFIGHCQRHYIGRLKVVTRVTDGLRIWGPRWPRYARLASWARKTVQGEGLWGDRYPRALRSTKVALGLLSKYIPETTTTRSFEIPATGTFMLAERNADHQSLFEEGKEAEFFGSDEELCDKLKFYLGHDTARSAIAQAGHLRCLGSGYSDVLQLRRVLDRISAQLGVIVPS
jgi:spore maturation protein CgeB